MGSYLDVRITQTFPNSLVGEAANATPFRPQQSQAPNRRPKLNGPTTSHPAAAKADSGNADSRPDDRPAHEHADRGAEGRASDTVLPIWVGIFEANAIALELEKTATPRPMTHDLMRNMARGFNAVVRKIVVSELRDDTFYAVIWMEQDGETVAIDSRPSDAIALALRWDCPIYASRTVLETAKQVAEGPQKADSRRDAALAGESERRRDGPLQNVISQLLRGSIDALHKKSLLQRTAGALMSVERLLRDTDTIDPASVNSVLILEYCVPLGCCVHLTPLYAAIKHCRPNITITVAIPRPRLQPPSPQPPHRSPHPHPRPHPTSPTRRPCPIRRTLPRRNLHPDCTLTGVSDQRTRNTLLSFILGKR